MLQPSKSVSPLRFLPALFVTGAWAVMALATIVYVYVFGSPLPFFDDLAVLSDLKPGAVPTVGDLFQPTNDHLMPLGRFAYWLSWTAFDGTVRPLLFAQACVLIVTCLFVIVRLTKDRGYFRLDDILVPLALLAAGHWSQLIWAICLTGCVSTAMISILIANLMRAPHAASAMSVIAIAFSLLFLAYQSASGLLLAIGLLPFLTLLVIIRFRERTRSRYAMAVTVIALGGMLLMALSYQLNRPAVSIDNSTSLLAKGVAFIQSLAMCFGALGRVAWPAAGCIVLLVVSVTACALLHHDTHAFRQFSAATLLRISLFVPPILLTVAIASGRAKGGALAPHYFVLQSPLWVVVAAAWANLPKSALQSVVLRAVVILLSVAYGMDFCTALPFGRERREQTAMLQSDLRSGAHADRIAAIYSAYWDSGKLTEYESQLAAIAALKKGLIGQLDCSPSFEFVDLPVDGWIVSDATQQGDGWKVTERSRMFYRFDRQFDSIRITFEGRTGWITNMAMMPIVDSLPAWAQDIPARRSVPLRNPVTQHFVFPRSADAVVLLPNDTPSDFQIKRVEGGTIVQ